MRKRKWQGSQLQKVLNTPSSHSVQAFFKDALKLTLKMHSNLTALR